MPHTSLPSPKIVATLLQYPLLALPIIFTFPTYCHLISASANALLDKFPCLETRPAFSLTHPFFTIYEITCQIWLQMPNVLKNPEVADK